MCNTLSFSAICKHKILTAFPRWWISSTVLTFQRRYKDEEGEGVVGWGGGFAEPADAKLIHFNYGFVLFNVPFN
jgi:hypothetical protein